MNLIITLISCLLITHLFTLISKRFNLSVVIGLIVSGLILGSTFLKDILIGPNTEIIFNLGHIGIIALMFLAGIEISWTMFYKEKKDSAIVAFFAITIPFAIGFLVFFLFGFSIATSLTVGICMGITAEATKARVLLELKKLKTKIGSVMMGAGIIDDILGIVAFITISYFFANSVNLRELAVLISAISAFFIGVLLNHFINREDRKFLYLEKSLLFFIVPFFFISMGFEFQIESLVSNPLMVIGVIFLAIIGKILGALATKPFNKLKLKQLYLVGWGMNSRGAVELAIAFVAFNIGLISASIYSALVVMAFATTLIFPFFFRRIVKNNPKVMN